MTSFFSGMRDRVEAQSSNGGKKFLAEPIAIKFQPCKHYRAYYPMFQMVCQGINSKNKRQILKSRKSTKNLLVG